MLRKFLCIPLIVICLSNCCDSSSIPKNLSKLDSDKNRDRNEAALALARCGSKASSAVPRLAELLYDESVGIQSSAAYALREINTPEAREVMARVEAARRKSVK